MSKMIHTILIFFFKRYFSMVFIQIYRVHQMLKNVSTNVLVQIGERTYAFKRRESSARKSMYVIINHFGTSQPFLPVCQNSGVSALNANRIFSRFSKSLLLY